MPLPPAMSREPLHRRAIDVRAFRRADGLYEIEATLHDTRSTRFDNGWRTPVEPGEPLHAMALRVAFDDDLIIRAIDAASDAHPYPGACDAAVADYAALVGVTLGPGLNAALRDAIGPGEGCVHLSDLLRPIATVAYITRTLDDAAPVSPEPPRFLGGCRALRLDGPVVARDYPAAAAPESTSSRDGNG